MSTDRNYSLVSFPDWIFPAFVIIAGGLMSIVAIHSDFIMVLLITTWYFFYKYALQIENKVFGLWIPGTK